MGYALQLLNPTQNLPLDDTTITGTDITINNGVITSNSDTASFSIVPYTSKLSDEIYLGFTVSVEYKPVVYPLGSNSVPNVLDLPTALGESILLNQYPNVILFVDNLPFNYAINDNGFNGGVGTSITFNNAVSVTSLTSSKTNLPVALSNATTIVINGVLYVIGGQDNAGSVVDTIYVPTVDSTGVINGWTLASISLPVALSNVMACIGTDSNGVNYLYIVGGYNGTTEVDTVYYIPISELTVSGSTFTSTAAYPFIITGGYLGYSGNYLFVQCGAGGGTNHSSTYSIYINAGGSLTGPWSDTNQPQAFSGPVIGTIFGSHNSTANVVNGSTINTITISTPTTFNIFNITGTTISGAYSNISSGYFSAITPQNTNPLNLESNGQLHTYGNIFLSVGYTDTTTSTYNIQWANILSTYSNTTYGYVNTLLPWETVSTDIPVGLINQTSGIMNGNLYIIGGSVNGTASDVVYGFDLLNNLNYTLQCDNIFATVPIGVCLIDDLTIAGAVGTPTQQIIQVPLLTHVGSQCSQSSINGTDGILTVEFLFEQGVYTSGNNTAYVDVTKLPKGSSIHNLTMVINGAITVPGVEYVPV